MLRRLLQTLSFHPYIALTLVCLAYGPCDNCPLC